MATILPGFGRTANIIHEYNAWKKSTGVFSMIKLTMMNTRESLRGVNEATEKKNWSQEYLPVLCSATSDSVIIFLETFLEHGFLMEYSLWAMSRMNTNPQSRTTTEQTNR